MYGFILGANYKIHKYEYGTMCVFGFANGELLTNQEDDNIVEQLEDDCFLAGGRLHCIKSPLSYVVEDIYNIDKILTENAVISGEVLYLRAAQWIPICGLGPKLIVQNTESRTHYFILDKQTSNLHIVKCCEPTNPFDTNISATFHTKINELVLMRKDVKQFILPRYYPFTILLNSGEVLKFEPGHFVKVRDDIQKMFRSYYMIVYYTNDNILILNSKQICVPDIKTYIMGFNPAFVLLKSGKVLTNFREIHNLPPIKKIQSSRPNYTTFIDYTDHLWIYEHENCGLEQIANFTVLDQNPKATAPRKSARNV
jgi:hypothetical protein